MADLPSALEHGDLPASTDVRDAVAGMVAANDGYVQFRIPIQVGRTCGQRSAALKEVQQYVVQVARAVPQVEPLYAGVFRPLSGYALDPIHN